MKIEKIEVFGFKAALRGMRNPMDSWDKSDSEFHYIKHLHYAVESPVIGPKDMALALKLIKGGSEHRKFLRQIQVWWDITAPRYVWQELDTYKVATVRNSCSTMHKLGTRDLTQEDFELPIGTDLLCLLNQMGREFRAAKVVKDTEQMNLIRREYKNVLPEGFLQKATYSFNYETAMTMYRQRKNHRLPEWNAGKPGSICAMIRSLPYMDEFLGAVE